MISPQSYTREWILEIRETSPDKDPILIEKMILALSLVEQLQQQRGLNFVFKGGTSLLLLLGKPNRFSIDIDIVMDCKDPMDGFFDSIMKNGVFHRYELDVRTSNVPKQHYKFFFNSVIQEKESHILLDILFETHSYPRLQTIKIETPFLVVEDDPAQVTCPVVECLLGDKLTAFAPHTTGILYKKGKELEIIKQLFDIGLLFDASMSIHLVKSTFLPFATRELGYRHLSHLSPDDVLLDAFKTACLIGVRDNRSEEFMELQSGIKKLAAFIYSGHFTLDSAILCASKAAYLTMLLKTNKADFDRFDKGINLAAVNIFNPEYNKLNKIKKTSPEAFFNFYKALELYS